MTFVVATYLPPTTRYVEGMLDEHGMTSANLVVTPALARNDDDEDNEEASTTEHRILRRFVDKSQLVFWLHAGQTVHSPRTVWPAPWQNFENQISLPRNFSYGIFVVRWILARSCKCKTERACTTLTLTVFTDSDGVSDRHTRKSVTSWVSCWVGS